LNDKWKQCDVQSFGRVPYHIILILLSLVVALFDLLPTTLIKANFDACLHHFKLPSRENILMQ